ncbi:VOC family protein [Pacificimonas sp. ICDLI1SI03]
MNLTASSLRQTAIVQNAYYVSDLDEAVESFSRAFCVGPFLMRRNLKLSDVLYRGERTSLKISAAHAQAGDLQIELVQQHGDEPSAFRDMYQHNEGGFHHVAIIPEDHDAMVAHYQQLGFAAATELRTQEGRGATYMDTRALTGHMLEIYYPNPSLIELYKYVEQLAQNWDGKTLRVEE